MKLFGFEIKRKIDDAGIAIRTVKPSTKPISKIPEVRIATLTYAQQFAIARSQFLDPEYDLSIVGKIEDSVAGDRYTVVKIANKLKVITFEELWEYLSTLYSIEEQEGREYIYPSDFQVLSGEPIQLLDKVEDVHKIRGLNYCRVPWCKKPYESNGFCSSHRSEYRQQGWVNPGIKGVWKPCEMITRHKVSKPIVRFLQKHGSTETTQDHSLLTINNSILSPFKPEEKLSIAKLTHIEYQRQLTYIDLANYSNFPIEQDEIVDINHRAATKINRFLSDGILESFCIILGAFVAEGSTKKTDKGPREFAIHNSNRKWLEDINNHFHKVFPDIPTTIGIRSKNKDDSTNTWALTCSRRLICDLFVNLCGSGSENKQLPDFVFELTDRYLNLIEKFMWDGDGHQDVAGWSYTTKSLKLASQYSLLLRIRGINHTYNYRIKEDKLYYSLQTNLGFECYSQYETILQKRDAIDEYVYDLEVKDTHNFIDAAGQVLLHNTESYVRKAFEKKEGLMFKEGLTFRGKNKDTLRYIKARMAQIARASNIPTISLIKQIAESLIRVSNAFLVKVRDPEASGGKIRTTIKGKELKPVAAYFPAAPETISVEIDPNTSRVVNWRQTLPDGKIKDFPADDVIHFHIARREGFLFGIPTTVPVEDDIRALRQIEENVELLLYQHLFPLYHYKVGTETAPAGVSETGSNEVDLVKEEIRLMPAEGAIVTPERHEIKAIGAEGRAINAENYIQHFKRRVLAGLGVSEVDMGEGQTVNRATANTLSRAIIDAVKALQDVLEVQFEHAVISELLLESTFGDDVLEEDNMVHLKFHEIDIQNKIEEEKHATEVFKANGYTWDEYRSELGLEPIPVPEDPEDQDPAKYPEWFNTYWKLFAEPEFLIKAVDEPYGEAAQAAAAARSSGVTNKQLQTAQQAKDLNAQKEAEQDRQTKIAVARVARRQQQDACMSETFKELEHDTAQRVEISLQSLNGINFEYLTSHARTWAEDAANKLYSLAFVEFIRGFNDHTGHRSSEAEVIISRSREEIRSRISGYAERLAVQTINLFKRRANYANTNAMEALRNAFDSTRFRTGIIWPTELQKAYNYGHLQGTRLMNELGLELLSHPDGCENCKANHGRIIYPMNATLDDVPPLHPWSRMMFRTIKNSNPTE